MRLDPSQFGRTLAIARSELQLLQNAQGCPPEWLMQAQATVLKHLLHDSPMSAADQTLCVELMQRLSGNGGEATEAVRFARLLSGQNQVADIDFYLAQHAAKEQEVRALQEEQHQISMADTMWSPLAMAISSLAQRTLQPEAGDASTSMERLQKQQKQAGMLIERMKNIVTLLRLPHPPAWYHTLPQLQDDTLEAVRWEAAGPWRRSPLQLRGLTVSRC